MREACESQLVPAGSANQCYERGVRRQPRCTSAGIDRLAGLVSFTMSASTPPTASRRWDWDWGRLPAVADQPQMEAEGWNPVLLAACWRGLAAPSTGTNPSSCAYGDMFAPTNAWCPASRALLLAPQQFLAAISPAWSPAAPPVPVRRACCSRIGMPCSGTPDIAQGSRSLLRNCRVHPGCLAWRWMLARRCLFCSI